MPAKMKHPPGPYGHWLWGILPQFQKDSLAALTSLQQQYGDAVRFHALGPFYGYIFTHPDHNKYILQDNNRNYTKQPNPSNQLLKVALLGDGLLTSDGDFWRRQRRLAAPAFHRRRIASFGQTMVSATDRLVQRWQPRIAAGQHIDVDQEMMALTLEIVGWTLFSMDITAAADTVGTSFTAVNELVSQLTRRPFSDQLLRLPFFPATRQLRPHRQKLESVINSIIQTRRAQPPAALPDDLLTLLMAAEDEETGEQMDDQQLRDELMTIMLAGHETTAVALTWTFYLLAQHPDVRQALSAELEDVLNGRLPTVADIPQLPYTTMIIEETMRLYPPAYAMARYGNDADVIGGYDVAKDAIITLSPYITHRHPDFWPNPTQFDPLRFTPQQKAQRPRYAYLPFGGGPRMCIGHGFAMTEAILLLATIAQRVQLSLIRTKPAQPDGLITLRPLHGMPMMGETLKTGQSPTSLLMGEG